MDTTLTRRAWGVLEPLHVVCFLGEGPRKAFEHVGLPGRRGYFTQRAAALGPVGPELVTAIFYVFAPSLVAAALPSAWAKVSPAEATEIRRAAVGEALHGVLGDPDVTEAVELARTACAGLGLPGRPLYAAHSGLDWPEDPLLQLWHAVGLLREHRGDGHNAVLAQHGLGPVEALITDGLTSGNLEFVRATRGWTDEQWAAGYDRLRARGLVDGDALTPDGVALRASVEAGTDAAATAGWEHLGADGAARLIELAAPLRATIRDAGILPPWLFARG